MVRARMSAGWRVAGVVVLAVVLSAAHGQAPDGKGAGGAPGEADPRLQECARLRREAEEHQKAGRSSEAVAATEKVLALEEKIYGAWDVRLLGTLEKLCWMHFDRDDMGMARKPAQRALDIANRKYGAGQPEERDAYWRLDFVDRLLRVSRNKRQAMLEMGARLADYARQGKWREGLSWGEKLRAIEEEALGQQHPYYAITIGWEAAAHEALKEWGKAVELRRKELAISKSSLGENHPRTQYRHDLLVNALAGLADMAESGKDFTKAAEVLAEVVSVQERHYGEKHWRAVDARLDLAHTRFLGTLNDHQHQELAQASRIYSQSEQICRKHHYQEASLLLLQAQEVQKAILGEKDPYYVRTLIDLAGVYRALGDNAQALKVHLQVRDLEKEILGERHPRFANTLHNLAEVYRALGDNAQALKINLQVRDLRKEIQGEKHPDYAATLNNLAMVYRALGDNAQALKINLQVRDLRKEIQGEKHPDYATTLNSLAVVYQALGDNAQALKTHLQVRDLRKEILGDKHLDYAITLNNLATVYLALLDNAQALKVLSQVRDLLKELDQEKQPLHATALNNLAKAYSAAGDHNQALEILLRVCDLRKRIGQDMHPDYANALANLADEYRNLGDNTQALKILLEVRELRKKIEGENHPQYATTLRSLGLAYRGLGNYTQALKFHQRVRELRREILGEKHPDYAEALNELAVTYSDLEDYPQAAALCRQALNLFRDSLDRSAAALSERQQLAQAQGHRNILTNYLMCAAAANLNEPEAYAPVLVWRGAVTARQRLIRAARATAADPVTATLFAQLEDLSRQLATLYDRAPDKPAEANLPARIEELIAQRERVEADLAGRTAAFRQVRAGRSLTPARLQELLPPGVVLVDFVEHGGDKEGRDSNTALVAFVVRREAIRRVELGKARPIAEAVRGFRGMLRRGRQVTGADDPAVTLRRLVWEPLEGAVKGAQVVLLSPDGPLNDLPFAALPGREKGKYLLEEVALAVVPVPQMLPELLDDRGRADRPSSLLLLGDIDYDAAPGASPAVAPEAVASSGPRSRAERTGQRQNWQRLPGMRQEALTIADAFRKAAPQGRLRELTGGGATEAAVRRLAPGHTYFHAATHGFFAPRDVPQATVRNAGRGLLGSGVEQVVGFHPGLLSGLVLAGANRPSDEGDDGVLTALEVSELDLSGVEVAVLSACETGLGEVAGGDGVLGLQRAFQVAGARSAVTSLWKVDDAATRALMARFYENLWKHKKGLMEALREAQLWMLHGGQGGSEKAAGDRGLGGRTEGEQAWAAPYYWAAFVLSGDWR